MDRFCKQKLSFHNLLQKIFFTLLKYPKFQTHQIKYTVGRY